MFNDSKLAEGLATGNDVTVNWEPCEVGLMTNQTLEETDDLLAAYKTSGDQAKIVLAILKLVQVADLQDRKINTLQKMLCGENNDDLNG